ncbi:hypothetical protein V8G54_005603 [Vigna mungo]|uniref:Uncharacterized protein n=1 Tax=Vigna mungo TaxID=3915 RepID=A0AAQ3NXF7_VIGMU
MFRKVSNEVLKKLDNPHLIRSLYMVEFHPRSKFLRRYKVYPKFVIGSPVILHSRWMFILKCKGDFYWIVCLCQQSKCLVQHVTGYIKISLRSDMSNILIRCPSKNDNDTW